MLKRSQYRVIVIIDRIGKEFHLLTNQITIIISSMSRRQPQKSIFSENFGGLRTFGRNPGRIYGMDIQLQ